MPTQGSLGGDVGVPGSESYTAFSVRADMAVVSAALGIAPPSRFLNLAAALERPHGTVVIAGLVKRGKSTLLNRLVGARVSKSGRLPETAANIEVGTGPKCATGETLSGDKVSLPSAPSAFASAAQRSATPAIAKARIEGPFRLPANLVLVDTPGIDDSVAENSELAERLARDWKLAGADGAVVVLSVPPASISGVEIRLISEARDVFGDAITVVLKATDSSITADDLIEIRDDAARRCGSPVIITPDVVVAGPWGAGPYSELERDLDAIAASAARHRQEALHDFHDWLSVSCSDIAQLGVNALPRLEAAAAAINDNVTASLATAVATKKRELGGPAASSSGSRKRSVRTDRSALANSPARRSLPADAGGRRSNSRYTLWALVGLGFVSLLYTGVRAKKNDWMKWGAVYGVLVIGASTIINAVAPADPTAPTPVATAPMPLIGNVATAVFFVTGVISAIHVFRVREEWLRWEAGAADRPQGHKARGSPTKEAPPTSPRLTRIPPVKKKYTPGRFLFDLFMTSITGGLWLIWLIFKFLRTRPNRNK